MPSRILVLKVDYVKRVFEGYTLLSLRHHKYSDDSLPVVKQYHPPADFGNLRLIYAPSGDTLFDGSIIWMGKGAMKVPARLDSTSLSPVNPKTHPMPEPGRFQKLHHEYVYAQDSIPWNAIGRLSILDGYLKNKKRIGYFLYTPSVGMGNPLEWDWLFFFSD